MAQKEKHKKLPQKRAEEALAVSEIKYRTLVEMTGTGYLILDAQGRVLDANQEYVRLSGHGELRDILGRSVIEWTTEEAKQRNSEAVAQCVQDGFIRHFVTEYADASGKITFVEINATTEGKGESLRIVSLCRDITELKLAESERMQLRLELAHLGRVMMMSELATSLAHEINQPLGAILNNASAAKLLLSQVKDKHGDLNEILADIIIDARRAGDVVRKIRGIVKKGDAQLEPLNLHTLIGDIVQIFHNSFTVNKISLVLDLQEDLAQVKGDRVRLQQVMMNLITNALEAMNETSTKVLTIRSAMQTQDTVIVSVSDSGTGIDEARKGKAFKPFFTTKKDGLGMGLRICQSIIEEHGGTIWAENKPDAGATFLFSLKAWRGESA